MICLCGTKMIWGGDFDYEDYGLEGDGIVSNYSCSCCGAYVEFYSEGKGEYAD